MTTILHQSSFIAPVPGVVLTSAFHLAVTVSAGYSLRQESYFEVAGSPSMPLSAKGIIASLGFSPSDAHFFKGIVEHQLVIGRI